MSNVTDILTTPTVLITLVDLAFFGATYSVDSNCFDGTSVTVDGDSIQGVER